MNAATADCAKEIKTETASARAAAPVASCTTAAIDVIVGRCSQRTM
jgi:hypothetical protein